LIAGGHAYPAPAMSGADTQPTDVHSDVLDTPEAGSLVVRGGILRVAGFVVGVLCSLGGVVLVTRHLGPERYGQFQTVLNLLTVVQAVTDIGMATLGTREFAQRRGDDRVRFIEVLLGLRIALTFVGVAVAFAISLAAGYDAALIGGALLGGLGLILTVIYTTLIIPLNAELRLGTVTALEIARQALLAAAYALLVLAGAGVLPFLAATVPVMIVLVIWTSALVRGRISLRPAVDLPAWRGLLTVSITFALAIAVGTVYQYTSQILTSFVSTAEQTGLFSAAFRTYVVIAAVPGVLVSSAFPLLSRAARDDRERLAYALRKLTDAMTLAGVAAALGMIVGAPAIIQVIAGTDYTGAIPVLRIQGIGMLMTFAITTWGFGLMSMHAHRPMIVANAFSLVVATGTVLALAPSHGARGAAWATVAGEGVLAVAYYVAVARIEGPLRPRFGVPIRGVAAGLVAAAAAVATDLAAVPATVLALLVYAILIVVVRAIPQELVDVLPGALRSRIVGSR
jgi:O-antigen/teichoic acid export membrane protein